VDTIIVWDMPDPSWQPAFRDFTEVFSQGRLRIFVRKVTP
jgi:hypothetical protein